MPQPLKTEYSIQDAMQRGKKIETLINSIEAMNNLRTYRPKQKIYPVHIMNLETCIALLEHVRDHMRHTDEQQQRY